MKRKILIALLLLSSFDAVVSTALAARKRVVVHRGRHRTTVVVHRTFPIHRRLPAVVVRPARIPTRVFVAPAVFLAPVVWRPVVIELPAAPDLVWENAEGLEKEEDWTEFQLDVDRRGHKLYLEVEGKVQIEFAEVVFENGDTQVVDFEAKTHTAGLYAFLDFVDGRKVDHVRMVARAKSDSARIVLRMS